MKRIINLLFKALSRYGGNKSENLRNEVKKKIQAWAGERCCTMRIHTYNQEAPVYTIHDGIYTIEPKITILESKLKEVFARYLEKTPKFHHEFWCKECKQEISSKVA